MKTILNQKSKSLVSNEFGMTLVEIMIVIGIIASITAVLVTNIKGNLDKSNLKETKIIISRVSQSLNLYLSDCGHYPQTLEGLVKPDSSCTNWGPQPYEKKIPKDAWNNELTYTLDGNNFEIKSLGPDGKGTKPLSSNDD